MLFFWISIGLSLFFSVKGKNDSAIIMTILSFSFIVVAIVTKDPVFTSFGVPAEYEWILGLFLFGFSSWKLYFNPLKERVIKNEKSIVEIKVDVRTMREDISDIKNELFGVKEKINSMSVDLHLIRNKLLA